VDDSDAYDVNAFVFDARAKPRLAELLGNS